MACTISSDVPVLHNREFQGLESPGTNSCILYKFERQFVYPIYLELANGLLQESTRKMAIPERNQVPDILLNMHTYVSKGRLYGCL